jgi:hypothetical protein
LPFRSTPFIACASSRSPSRQRMPVALTTSIGLLVVFVRRMGALPISPRAWTRAVSRRGLDLAGPSSPRPCRARRGRVSRPINGNRARVS